MLWGMAVHITIDLAEATFSDLVALVDAARVAGVEPTAALELEDTTLGIRVEPGQRTPAAPTQTGERRDPASTLPPLGDAAIRSVVDILTGRQEPPRK